MEKIGYARIIAVTKNGLTLEVFLVMLQFVFYIRKLRIKFVFFCVFRIM